MQISVLIKLLPILAGLGASAGPIKREVPQEHAHEKFMPLVRASLNLNNPLAIQDPVFGLLGNAAGSVGQGKVTDTDCLQQETADQAFTNAKAAGDVTGMTAALIYRALERNTGKVGLASVLCTSVKAVNPEIAALTQHQDPASPGAAATNKALVLVLAQQIASIGGNPQDALQSGTFAPGDVNDNTGKGNTCDDANDPVGCIFTQNLLVEDATPAEIDAAVAGVAVDKPANGNAAAAPAAGTECVGTVTVTASAAAPTATAAASEVAAAPAVTAAPAAGNNAAAGGANKQTFTGALNGVSAPAVTVGGRGFIVNGNDFLNLKAAIQRSCDIQNNGCADAFNSGKGTASVGECTAQQTACAAA